MTFHAAYSGEDGIEACQLLSEETRTEFEQSSGKPCDAAVLEEKLSDAEQVVDIAAYGALRPDRPPR